MDGFIRAMVSGRSAKTDAEKQQRRHNKNRPDMNPPYDEPQHQLWLVLVRNLFMALTFR